ncbi:uncharacterized protein BDV17DRAFT_210379 [Aspergillus undulatus]|uniref:uncharacterized protein n=1 Tax=Aspergillus undulatus TaxID=1810928 RepID=UPI003CCD5964
MRECTWRAEVSSLGKGRADCWEVGVLVCRTVGRGGEINQKGRGSRRMVCLIYPAGGPLSLFFFLWLLVFLLGFVF